MEPFNKAGGTRNAVGGGDISSMLGAMSKRMASARGLSGAPPMSKAGGVPNGAAGLGANKASGVRNVAGGASMAPMLGRIRKQRVRAGAAYPTPAKRYGTPNLGKYGAKFSGTPNSPYGGGKMIHPIHPRPPRPPMV